MKQPKKVRERKVYYAFYPQEHSVPHPLIRISGKYLEQFDFRTGDDIKISFEKGKIVIEKRESSDMHSAG